MLCKHCHKPIPDARLKALPSATSCVDCSDVNKVVGFQVITSKTTYSELAILNPESSVAKDFKRMTRKGRYAYSGKPFIRPKKSVVGGLSTTINDKLWAWKSPNVTGIQRGVDVPIEWVREPEKITKKTIMLEGNAERRRCIREILGTKKYFELLGHLELIDEDTDAYGNNMKLYQIVEMENDNRIIQFVEVKCPSTQKIYTLYPPKQQDGTLCRTVWEAKADTFSNEKIQYRHGDVGLLNLNKSFDKPIKET